MGRIFRYEINPLYLKAAMEKISIPDIEESWQYFQKIHQTPRKVWRPQIKIPTVQISKIYLNGIIVSLFMLLFLYLVFFRGNSGMSEKKDEMLIKKVSIQPNKIPVTNKVEKNIDTNFTVNPNLKSIPHLPDTSTHTKDLSASSPDTLKKIKAGNTEFVKNKNISESEERKNIQTSSIQEVSKNDTINNNENNSVLNKKKKRKRRKTEEAEFLPSVGSENITLPLGNSNEEEIKLRGE